MPEERSGLIFLFVPRRLFGGLCGLPIEVRHFRLLTGVFAGCARLITFFANTLLAHFLSCVLACVTHDFTCGSRRTGGLWRAADVSAFLCRHRPLQLLHELSDEL